MNLPSELEEIKERIKGYALAYSLDFFETIFEIVDFDQMNEIAAYGGFPTRYPHWRFGMEYEELGKGYAYGLQKIYELVINNAPCYAYLLECNNIVDQKLVIAHVYGHCDFFKNNIWFSKTNRKMVDEMANHASRIRRIVEQEGEDVVENFIDTCLSIEDLIDPHSLFIERRRRRPETELSEEPPRKTPSKLKSKDYMDSFINPPDFVEEQKKKLEDEESMEEKIPENPEKDVLLFLLERAPLKRWQQEILSIVREESYYFAPQGQTKILNEGWACATSDSLLITEKGLMRFGDVVEAREKIGVDGGPNASIHRITDFHKERQVTTVRITTRRGLTIEGAIKHRVLLADRSWGCLGDIKVGYRVAIARGSNVWPEEKVCLDFTPLSPSPTLKDVAAAAGTSARIVIRYRKGKQTDSDERIAVALAETGYRPGSAGKIQPTRHKLCVPEFLDEDLAYVLGVFVGDGHKTKSGIGFTCRTEADAKDLGRQIEAIFGVPAKVYWDPPEKAETSSAGGRWRVEVHSRELKRFLTYLGIDLSALARSKAVPKALLRSPREVVSAFLRGYFDADGYAGKGGVILSSSSRELMKTVQLLLLNYGILSTQRKQAKDNWHLEITGQSAARFLSEIGLSRKAKRRALEKYVMDRHWFKQEDESDQVASIEHGCADVFDITVETSQAYVANGFINHNSYWHSKIMTEKALEGSELIDYADHHSGTMGTRPGRINPYKLGVELFRDIEDRWNKGKFGKDYEECDDLKEKKRWDKKVGLGREKIFEVRRIYNDVSFIDTFLTEEFCQEQKLFTYRFNHHTGFYEIADRDYKKVKEKLLFSLTNFGKPFIYVIESNYGNRGELYLKHRHEGVDLKLNYARDTLRNINYLWGRPVHLETAVDGQGKILTYDGKKHYDRDIKADQT